jgi:hypothetical protein
MPLIYGADKDYHIFFSAVVDAAVELHNKAHGG